MVVLPAMDAVSDSRGGCIADADVGGASKCDWDGELTVGPGRG